MDSAAVLVETVSLGAWRSRLTYRVRAARLGDRAHPDTLARSLAFPDGEAVAGGLLHSTSWRYEPGSVVLTYVALPDPEPDRGRSLAPDTVLAAGTGPLEPSPSTVDVEQVVVHACRHLAWLRHTDPVVAALVAEAPALWALIDGYRPATAGLLVQP